MARAGQLRERVTFERNAAGSIDAYGNVYSGWSTLATRWGDIRERTGKEGIEGGALTDTGMATLRVRKDSTTGTVTAADRVSARGITWAIKNVIQTDRKGELLEMLLEKGVAS